MKFSNVSEYIYNESVLVMSSNTIKKSKTEMTKMPSFSIAVDQPRLSYTDGGCLNWYKHFGKLWYLLSRSDVIQF